MAVHRVASGVQLIWNRSSARVRCRASSSVESFYGAPALWSKKSASLHTQEVGGTNEHAEASSNGVASPTPHGPYNSQIRSRGVLLLEGPDVLKFLQGLVTNDIKRLERLAPANLAAESSPRFPGTRTGPLYTAFLNPQGRFLYDLFLYRPTHSIELLDRAGFSPGEGGDGVPLLLADVDLAVLEELVSHLKKHRLRAKVKVEDVSNDLKVWQRFGGPSTNEYEGATGAETECMAWGGDMNKSTQQRAEDSRLDWGWYKDPRLGELGLRGIFPVNSFPPLVTADQEVGEEHYLAWRLEQGVAEGSTEIPKGEAIPLEYNLAGLNAISFEKGCYVGQELVARTHHRGVIRKRVMPVNFVDEDGTKAQQEVIPGVEILDVKANKKVGKVTAVLGPRGLALLRLDAVSREASQLKLAVSDTNVYLKASRPKWWSGDWGRDEQQQTVANA